MKTIIEIQHELVNEVEIEAFPKMVDVGIGHYEYFGQKGFDSRKIVECKEINYNKTLYSDEQCKVIDSYIYDNFETLINYFCENYESN